MSTTFLMEDASPTDVPPNFMMRSGFFFESWLFIWRLLPSPIEPRSVALGGRVCSKKILAEVSSALDKIFLVLPVAHFSQTPHQQAVTVAANQAVPVRAPDHLDDV